MTPVLVVARLEEFAYGEATVLQMRSQPFEVEDELGTVVTMPIETNPRRTMLIEEDTLPEQSAALADRIPRHELVRTFR